MSSRVNLTVRHFPQDIHKNDVTRPEAYFNIRSINEADPSDRPV